MGEPGATPDVGRLALASASALLLALAFLHEGAEARGRSQVEGFLKAYTLDRRRPDMAGTARVEGSADLAMQVAVRSAVLDLAGTAPLAKLEPDARALWLRSIDTLREETSAAVELGLISLARRPAWAYNAEALAELVLVGEWCDPSGKRPVERWHVPLRVATTWSPADRRPWAVWAAALVERWTSLPPEVRRDAAPVIETALRDERFLGQSLPGIVAALGPERALALIPETASALAAARLALKPSAAGFEAAVKLYRRWESAERDGRRTASARIDELLKGGRGDRARAAALSFLEAHPLALMDDAEGRSQALTILRAVSDGTPGEWEADPRGALVRYFLDGPERGAPGGDLLRAIAGLRGVPEVVRARLALAGGDSYGWRRPLDEVDSLASLPWTPLFVDLARRRLAEGDRVDAEAFVRRISRHAAGECEVLLVRRDVARAREDARELAAVAELWREAFKETLDASAWASGGGTGSLTVCVDPDRDRSRALVLQTRARGPAYLWWGWDGGREGTLLVEGEGERSLTFPLEGLSGRRTFSMGAIAGSAVTVEAARIGQPAASKPR